MPWKRKRFAIPRKCIRNQGLSKTISWQYLTNHDHHASLIIFQSHLKTHLHLNISLHLAKATSISLTVASFAMIDASSWGDISNESPVDSFPAYNIHKFVNRGLKLRRERLHRSMVEYLSRYSVYLRRDDRLWWGRSTFRLSSFKRFGVGKAPLKPTPYRSKTCINPKGIICTTSSDQDETYHHNFPAESLWIKQILMM